MTSRVRLPLLSLLAPAALLAQSPFPSPRPAMPAGAWEDSSIVSRAENARALAAREQYHALSLGKEVALLRVENAKLKEDAGRMVSLAKLDANDPEAFKAFTRKYNLLLGQYHATTEQLSGTQMENRRLAEALRTARTDAAREKARANAADMSLRSGREASGRLAEEANTERVRAAESFAKTASLEAETIRLREDKKVLEALVRRLDPERTAKLEQAVRERDQMLREAANKISSLSPHTQTLSTAR